MVYILLRKDWRVFNPFRSLMEEKDQPGIFLSYLIILSGRRYLGDDKPHVGIYDILTLCIPQLISEFTKYMKDWAAESKSTFIYLLSLPLRLIDTILMIPKLAFLFAASIAASPFICLYKGISYLWSPGESNKGHHSNREESSPEMSLFEYQENHSNKKRREKVNGHSSKKQVNGTGTLLPQAARFTVFAQKTRVTSEVQVKTRSVIEIGSPT
jgi:hypothetical protein